MPRLSRALVLLSFVVSTASSTASAAPTASAASGGTAEDSSRTFQVGNCIDGDCHNGRIHTVTVTADAFIVVIDPDRCGRSFYCPTRYDRFELEDGSPARVEGYEPGTASRDMFTVYVPRAYKKLFIEGIGKRDRFASIDLEIYERQLRGAAAPGTGSREAVPGPAPAAAPAAAGKPGGTVERRERALAVLFGIERYRYAPEAPFAAADATAFRGYLVGRGFPDERILLRLDEQATLGEFVRAFSSDGWVGRNAGPDSDVVVYFAGHVAADARGGGWLLLPHDADPGYPGAGWPLDDLLATVGRLGSSSVTLVLDASPVGSGEGPEPRAGDPPPGTLLLFAPGGPAGRTALAAERHGALTFELLRALAGAADADGDGAVAARELEPFLRREIGPAAAGGDGPFVLGDLARVPALP